MKSNRKFIFMRIINCNLKKIIYIKFVVSKKATKIDNLTLTTECQIDGEDFVNFCSLLSKHELYNRTMNFDTKVFA